MKRVTRIFLGIACASIGIGLLLAIIGFVLGGKIVSHGENTYDYSYKVENIKSIDLDVEYGYVKILKGNEFTAEVENVVENGFQGYVEGDTWHLKQNGKITDTLNIFGVNIPFSFGWFGHHDGDYPKITITVPEDFIAEEFEIELGAGEIKVEEMDTKVAEVSIGAGKMDVRNMNVTDEISCDVGAGELIIRELDTKKAKFECGVGSIKVDGKVAGDLDADCGMGEMDIILNGNEEEYNYNVSCGVGNINLNGHNYSFSSNNRIKNESSIGTIDLDCSVGSLKLRFK